MANSDIDAQIDDTMSDEDLAEQKKPTKPARPVFKVYEDSKIPVSKKLGMVWRERKSLAMRQRQNQGVEMRWEQTMRYYYNDHRPLKADGTVDDAGHKKLVGSAVTEVENLIYANARAFVPAAYAKVPDIEITEVRTRDGADETVQQEATHARVHERLVDEIMRRDDAPGVDMHTKMKRATLQTYLTDRCYLQVDFTKKEDSSEEALINLQQISEKYAKAKDAKEIEELEGQLVALEHKINFLSQSGPAVRVRRAFDVLIDPTSEMPNLSDAGYVMLADYLDVNLVNALYCEKDDNGEYKTVYKGTHVINAGSDRTNDGIDNVEYTNLIQIKEDKAHTSFGFGNSEDFIAAQRILVWYVWDKATRRVLMFADNNWEWPIWVWDDPYKLPGFYNIVPMYFTIDPEKQYSRSEVVYQLDLQDAINTCNSQMKKMRKLASDVFLYDKRLDDKVISEIVTGAIGGPKGIPIDTNGGEIKLQDAMSPLLPPSAHVKELFDATPYREALDRMSSITNVLRGVEYKTNTTNKAIESYEGGQQMRLDENIDTTENVIAKVGRMIMHMCVQFMGAEQVKELTDMPEVDEVWTNMEPAEFDKKHQFKVAGGSAIKPTSRAKKEEASLVVQQLGQFASASPVAFLIALKVFEKAYDSNVITKEDYELLRQNIESQIQAQQAQATGAQGAEGGEGGQGGEGGDKPITQGDVMGLIQGIDAMPPEVKAQFAERIASGEPVQQVIQQLIAADTQGAQNAA